jgi:hypothetical protein
MQAYYLLDLEYFNATDKIITTTNQLGIKDITNDRSRTFIEKKEDQLLKGYISYKLICEIKKHQKIRLYENFFDEFIEIKEKIFYYDTKKCIGIIRSPKEVYNQFCADFDSSTSIKFKKVETDFKYIIEHKNSKNIAGIWLGEIPDVNLKTLGLIGTQINSSNTYTEMLNNGASIKNITIIYKYNNSDIKIMLTSDGGIVFYKHEEESVSLPIINNIYDNLLKK